MAVGQTYTNEKGQLVDLSTGQVLGTGTSPTGVITSPGTITSSDFAPTESLRLPEQPKETDLASILSSIPTFTTQGVQQAEQTQGELGQRLLQTMEKLGGREERQLAVEEQFGIPEQQRQLTEMMNQIRNLQFEAAAIPIQLQQESEGRGRTAGGVAPIEASRQRENTLKALQVSAIAQAVQGNLQLAQQQANRLVDIEFSRFESELAYLQTAYTMNKDILDREDKKRSEQLSFALQERERVLADQKEERRNVQNMAMTALQYGATPDVAQRIGEAKTFEEAMQIGGRYLGEPFRLQMENQQFTQMIQTEQLSIAWRQLALQEQANKNAADQAVRVLSKEARDELTKTQAYQNWEMRGLISNDLDNTLQEFAGTAERDSVSWETLAASDSAVNAIATQLVYSRNPQLRRAMELGDAAAQKDVISQTEQIIQSLKSGRNIQPNLLRDRVREIDTNYRSSVQAYNKTVNDILERNPGAVLPGYSLSDVKAGTATKTVDGLLNSLPNTFETSAFDFWNSLPNSFR